MCGGGDGIAAEIGKQGTLLYWGAQGILAKAAMGQRSQSQTKILQTQIRL